MSEKLIAVLTTFVVAILYIVGFSFLYSYYKFFGIDYTELDFGIEYTLVHSFSAMRHIFDQYYLVIIALAIFIGIALAINYETVVTFFKRITFVIAIGLFLLFLLQPLAERAGADTAGRDLNNLRFAIVSTVRLNHSVDQIGKDLNTMHILSTNDVSYFVQSVGIGTGFWLLRIPKSRIIEIKTFQD